MSEEQAQFTEEDERQYQEAKDVAMFIRGSFKWRMAYQYMRFLMVIESLVWSIMDVVRAKRMKVAARINSNYQGYR